MNLSRTGHIEPNGTWNPIVLVLLLAMAGCATQERINREVTAWVSCVECPDSQFERIKGYGERALPELMKVMTVSATESDVEAARDKLRQRYLELQRLDYEHVNMTAWTNQNEYVDYHIGAMDIPRLRATYAIMLICEQPKRCSTIRESTQTFPLYAKNFISQEGRDNFLRAVARIRKQEY